MAAKIENSKTAKLCTNINKKQCVGFFEDPEQIKCGRSSSKYLGRFQLLVNLGSRVSL